MWSTEGKMILFVVLDLFRDFVCVNRERYIYHKPINASKGKTLSSPHEPSSAMDSFDICWPPQCSGEVPFRKWFRRCVCAHVCVGMEGQDVAVTPLTPYCTVNCVWILMSRSATSWPPADPWGYHLALCIDMMERLEAQLCHHEPFHLSIFTVVIN